MATELDLMPHQCNYLLTSILLPMLATDWLVLHLELAADGLVLWLAFLLDLAFFFTVWNFFL